MKSPEEVVKGLYDLKALARKHEPNKSADYDEIVDIAVGSIENDKMVEEANNAVIESAHGVYEFDRD